jgi:NTE family protein
VRYSRVVCVLSGGGAKAAAHLGALKALDEWKLAPGHFVGTSMGAVIAACFAAGVTYEELLVRIGGVSRGDVARISPLAFFGPFGSHLLKAGPLRDTIADLVPARRFGELGVPLTVTATDTESGQLVLFGAGGADAPLLDALYASCALPVFYPPGIIEGRPYADGGLHAVLPLDVAAQFEPDLVFAINVGPTFTSDSDGGFVPGMVKVHDMSTRILMAGQIARTIQRWRESDMPLVLVEPEVEQGTFGVGNAFAHVEAGYRTASRELAKWAGAGTGKRERGKGKGTA